MVLLDPADIKDEKKQREIESQKRIMSLGVAEAEANHRLNNILAREKTEKARIQAEAEEGIPAMETRKTILLTEVQALEVRKTEALRPVYELQAEAETKLRENNAQGDLIKKKSAQLERDSEIIVERTEALDEMVQENTNYKAKLDKRAKGITDQEAEIKRSAIELGNKWVEFHKTVLAKDAELRDREQKVVSDTKANEIFAQQLKKVEVEQTKQTVAIADKYATLERATKEFERKTNGKR